MRKTFLTAVALAPLYLAAAANAETVISNNRTTPIATSTAANGSPDSIRIDSGGKISLSSGAAVTVDSNNNVINDGNIDMGDTADGSTGILVAPGVSADITNNGNISLGDGYAAIDDDKDGDFDGPFAEGTDRKGIWVQGDLTGDVTNGAEAAIVVDGNDSYGILVDGHLTGDLNQLGQIRMTGDDTYAVRLMDGVTGDVTIGGEIAVLGENAVGFSSEGDILGALVIDGVISSTGYRYTQRGTDEFVDALDPDDLLQGGPAVWIQGDVTGGVLFARTPEDLDPDEDDEDGNGVPDDEQTTAQITSAGGAPAIRIGSMTDTVTLGEVGTGDDAFGFILRGNASAGGLYDGVEARAIEFGMVGGMAVDIAGGIKLEHGLVTGGSFDAEVLGMVLRDGVTTPLIYNDSALSATMIGDEDFDAIALLVESGANVPAIYNYESITALVAGEEGDAYGIVDRSGSVNLIENGGTISALSVATDDADDDDDGDLDNSNEVVNSQLVAIDLSANTTGVVIRQVGINDGDDLGDGVADNDADGDGVDDDDEPAIVGNIRMGSGDDLLDIQNGTVAGDVTFGLGLDTLTIDGGSFAGRIDDVDKTLALNVLDGSIEATNTNPVEIGELTVGSEGTLIVTLDPSAVGGEISGFIVSGAATFADGAELGVRFDALLTNTTSFTIVQAGDLTAGTLDLSSLQDNTPFIYTATAVVDTVNDELLLTVAKKSTAELGMIASEAAAYDAIYSSLTNVNSSSAVQTLLLRREFLSRLDDREFYNLYRQLMPNHSGGPLLSLTAGIDAVRHALADRRVNANPGEITAWVQQIDFYADKDQAAAYGFRSEGYGFAAGLERGGRMGTFGLSMAFSTSDMKDEDALLEENLTADLYELGVYWRTAGDNWRVWARGAGGFAVFDETREVVTPTVLLRFQTGWSGYSLAAGAGGSYDMNFGKWYSRAEGAFEYFYLSEGEHSESGGPSALRYHYDSRTGHILKAEMMLNIGRRFGQDGWLTPELRLGWRQNISSDLGVTTFRIGSSALRSTLHPDSIEGGGPVLGFRVTAGSQMGFLGFEGTAMLLDEYQFYSLMLRGGFRF